jgi:hypothetical protein
MNKLLLGLLSWVIVTGVCGEAIIYNPPTGNILAIEPESTQFDATRIMGAKIYSNVNWAELSLGHGTDCWNYVEGPFGTNLVKQMKSNISNVSDFVYTKVIWDQTEAVRIATLAGIKAAIWEISLKYGVTNSPLNWFTLKAAIKEASLIDPAAVAAGAELTSLSMFYKEWGGNLFAITYD